MDFTLDSYKKLLTSLLASRYTFVTFSEYLRGKQVEHTIILRHDVDLMPLNSLATAKIETNLGIKASYYFRAVPESWNVEVIKKIASLGHEVGYHYESLTTYNGDIDSAYKDFCKNLDALRNLVPVSTICMHGSPRSPYDSKDIWKKYSYKDLGIIGEPYLDTDFSQLFYITDTGRRWDGYKVSVRDKIENYQEEWIAKGLSYHSTKDIIKAVESGIFPKAVMMTTHPQRWNKFGSAWLKELVMQNVKNVVKRMLVGGKLAMRGN